MYDTKKCKKILSRIGLKEESIHLVITGMKWLKKKKIKHIDLKLKDIYYEASLQTGKTEYAVETVLQKDMKNVLSDEVFFNLNYDGHVTVKKLFLLLMEKFDM